MLVMVGGSSCDASADDINSHLRPAHHYTSLKSISFKQLMEDGEYRQATPGQRKLCQTKWVAATNVAQKLRMPRHVA
jgi:hypothetical protein